MSWDATLVDDRGHIEGDWNYTHNCNGMLREAAGIDESWWKALDGMSGPEGAAFIDKTIRGMESDPERYRAMNPKNKWGSYDSVLEVLRDMRAAVPEWPCTWEVSG